MRKTLLSPIIFSGNRFPPLKNGHLPTIHSWKVCLFPIQWRIFLKAPFTTAPSWNPSQWATTFLEEINLSSKLKTIGDEAFYDCRRLKQLHLPNTVTTIGEEAFTNCRSLQSLVIPNGVQTLGNDSSVGFGMFENCKSLKEITIPSSVGSIQSNAISFSILMNYLECITLFTY